MKYKIRYKGLDKLNRLELIMKLKDFFNKLYPSAKTEVVELTTSEIVKVIAQWGGIKRIYLCIMDEMNVIKLEHDIRSGIQITDTFTTPELKFFDMLGFELDPVYQREEYNQDITDWFGDIK